MFQIQAHEQKEGQLLYQISGLEEQLKGMNKENELLRQQHEATYSEMSRLTESKIAMRKQNDAFKGLKSFFNLNFFYMKKVISRSDIDTLSFFIHFW